MKTGFERDVRLRTIIFLFMVALCLVFWRFREPFYNGEPLSVWLRSLDPNQYIQEEDRQQARAAVKHIGAEALPLLIKMLHAEDPPWKQKLMELSEKQSFLTRISHR